MKTAKKIALASTIAALFAAVVAPAGAGADYYIPPGNSAVNQYTESIPGAGGESGGKQKGVTPAEAIGAKNAKKLQQHGEAGKEAAEVAAETAPPTQLYTEDTSSASAGGGKASGGKHSGSPSEGKSESAGNGGSGASGGGGSGSSGGSGQAAASTHVSQPDGSSGISSVLGEATGATDQGNLGLWLPLAILATIAGAVVYRLRLRQHGPTA